MQSKRIKLLTILTTLITIALLTTQVNAINGNFQQDSTHSFVGLVVFYDLDENGNKIPVSISSGILLSPTTVLTTAYGKFNKDLVLLSGDTLLFKGIFLLHKACEKLPLEKQQSIFDLIEKSFFKIGNALTIERCIKGKTVNLKEYQKILETKGTVTEACAEIGAIFGNGTKEEIKTLGHFGRILGKLMTIKNEFTDMKDPEELENRRDNEILPLPLMYAFENTSTNRQIIDLLQGRINKQKVSKISEIVMGITQVKNLKKQMSFSARKEAKLLDAIRFNRDKFKLLLQSSLTDL